MQNPDRYTKILPWLHLLGAMALVTLQALYSVVHSELGREISAGESPGLAWIRTHIDIGLAAGGIYLIAVCRLQMSRLSQLSAAGARWLKGLVGLEVLGIAGAALLMVYQRRDLLALAQTGLLICLLIQGLIAFWRTEQDAFVARPEFFQTPERGSGRFFFFLIFLGAVIALLDPSARRMAEQILLDTDFEQRLRIVFPPLVRP